MANSNFVVHNGLTIGPTTIFAGNGDVTTSGNISVTGSGSFGGLSSNMIYQGAANVTVSGSFVNVSIGSTNVASFSSTGLTVLGTTTTVQNETVTGSFTPAANLTYNIGSTSLYWNNAYVNALTATGITVNSGKILPGSNIAIDIGSTTAWFNAIYGNTFLGRSTTASYADLAENYQADKTYLAGTVLMFGGVAEVTVADAETTAVAGVVSTNPAHLMNGGLTGSAVVPVALTGRVPCNIIGPVKKGDLMVSAGFGFAKSSAAPAVGSVIGKALMDFPINSKGVIEVVVGRF